MSHPLAGLTLLVVCGVDRRLSDGGAGDRGCSSQRWRLAFFVGGVLLAADAWHRAWRPSLRIAFEELARAGRAEAAAEARVQPEEDSVFAIVTGTLRADATLSESGASLSIDVDH